MNMDDITQETLESVKKAQTSGVLNSTGLFGYDLSKWISLIPVETPFRNSVSRVASQEGAKFAIWRALLNVNNGQPDPAIGWDYAGTLANVDEQDMQAPFVPYAVAGRVTQDAVDLAKGYADARAIATVNVLNQLMIAEDKKMLGACSFALATPATPTLTPSATGGSLGSAQAVYVKVAARTGNNYYYGGSGVASAAGNVTGGTTSTTNSVVASVPAVAGALAYDWFVGSSSGSLFYLTTTTIAQVTIGSIPTANQAVPTTLPGLSTVAPTAPPTADGTAKPNDYNGLIASIIGDYSAAGQLVTPGTGTPSGASIIDNAGAKLTLSGGSITQIDNLFTAIYNAVFLSPTALMMNTALGTEIGQLALGSPSAVTYLQPNDGRTGVQVGAAAGSVVNKAAGGKVVPIEIHPNLPAGVIVARTDTVPFPGSNIGEVFELETHRDYADFSYGANYNPGVAGGGPREDFEVRVVSAFKCKAPTAQGLLLNVA